MTLQTLRTVLAGGALAAVLSLAGPAPAHAAAGPAGIWNWVAGLWGDGIATPWIGTGQAPRGHHQAGTAGGWEKAGSCVDPNGCAQTLGTTISVCSSRNSAGICLDPKG